MIAGFIIWTVCALMFIKAGLASKHSTKPAGFFANVEAPEVNNVEEYNQKVAKLWIVSGLLFELLGIPFLFAKQNSPIYIIPILGTVFLVIGMVIVYMNIQSKYSK